MSQIKLTKRDKKQIALGMIFHSLDVGLFGDSIATNTITQEDELEILDIIRTEQEKFLKRLDEEISNIRNVDEMVNHFKQKNMQ